MDPLLNQNASLQASPPQKCGGSFEIDPVIDQIVAHITLHYPNGQPLPGVEFVALNDITGVHAVIAKQLLSGQQPLLQKEYEKLRQRGLYGCDRDSFCAGVLGKRKKSLDEHGRWDKDFYLKSFSIMRSIEPASYHVTPIKAKVTDTNEKDTPQA